MSVKSPDRRTRSRSNFRQGVPKDAAELAVLHTPVARHLTETHGKGPWSGQTTEKGVLFAMRHSHVLGMLDKGKMVATLRLAQRKPWAIDTRYFSPCEKPLYLLAMAVMPEWQRQGMGRKCLAEAKRTAERLGSDALRLDAYDATAGADGFYARCGFAERGRTTYRGTALIYYELLLKRIARDREA